MQNVNRANGLFFPIILDEGSPVYPGLADSIDSSLRHIFSWIYGKRFFNPAFGTRIYYMIGAGATPERAHSIQRDVREAIERWEKRLSDVRVKVEVTQSSVDIDVQAIIANTQINYEFQTKI